MTFTRSASFDQPDRPGGSGAEPRPPVPHDPRFDAITSMATRLLDVGVALVSTMDAEPGSACSALSRVCMGSRTPRDFGMFAEVEPGRTLIVANASTDPRFADHPCVTGPPYLRFYAGVPLRGSLDQVVGTLCVFDARARQPTLADLKTLHDLALCAECVLDLHWKIADLRDGREHHGHALEMFPHARWTAGPDGRLGEVGKRLRRAVASRFARSGWTDLLHPEDRDRVRDLWSRSVATGDTLDVELRLRFGDGGYRWLRCHAAPSRDAEGSISGWHGTAHDVTELRDRRGPAEYLALHDVLTGLPNRLRFRRLLEAQIGRRPRGGSCALLCLDLHQLSAINTTLGHHAGDTVLRLAARRLMECLRPGDVLARTAGAAFSVIRPGRVTRGELAVLCEEICATLADPFPLDGQAIGLGCSIGVTLAPGDGVEPEVLLANAALALARATADGRGTWRGFEASMDNGRRQQQALRIELYEALRHGQLHLKYQPLVGLRSGRVEGFEALLRWQHPARGEISPGEFIPMAEENGLIVAIGSWVLRQACRQAMTWPADVCVSVNLSTLQFTPTRDLLWTVAIALSEVGLAPNRLELEITESLPLLDNDDNLAVLRQLRAMGVRIVLDDFGTGYASIGYLHRFEFDKLKIDRSIAARVNDDAKGRTILRAIINMSHTLGIRTTAEGVETAEQLEMLRADNCDQVQGFVFSPAVPARDVLGLIAGGGVGARPGAPPLHPAGAMPRALLAGDSR